MQRRRTIVLLGSATLIALVWLSVRPLVGHQQVREYRDAILSVSPMDGRISAPVVTGGVDWVDLS